MKFTSISLKISDLDEETAKLEIVLDPPIKEGEYTEKDFEDQPCMGLSQRILNFLQWIHEQESGGSGGEQRIDTPSIH